MADIFFISFQIQKDYVSLKKMEREINLRDNIYVMSQPAFKNC